ncbi:MULTISPECIES: fimbrial protein [Citrobacter]|uniref:fimbrial protein n=1 Tax=Citrobacter TaxID=544 RepID=UPI00351D72DF
MMKIRRVISALSLTGLLFSPACFAGKQGLSVDFTAVIAETTCSMKVSSVTNTTVSGNDPQYSLKIPAMALTAVVNTTAQAEGSFKLLPQECNNNITTLKMTIWSADRMSNSDYKLQNSLSGGAENIALGFKPKGSDDGALFRLDGSQEVLWRADQIENGFDISAFFRRSSTSIAPTSGDFQAKATFTFTYE